MPAAPIVMAVKENGSDMLRVICMALMNAIPTAVTVFGATYATTAGYGIGLTSTNYLWISVSGNIVAVVLIPFVGNLTDKIGRRPVMIVGILGSAMLAYPYLYFVSQGNLAMAFFFAILMWGIVYQGYNAVFPAFFQELFPTKTRVTAFAVSQNIGTLITAFLPAIYAAVVGPTPGCLCRRQEVRRPMSWSTGRPAGTGRLDRSGCHLDGRQHHPWPGHHCGHRLLQRTGDVPDPPERPRQQGCGADPQGGLRPHPEDRSGRGSLSSVLN